MTDDDTPDERTDDEPPELGDVLEYPDDQRTDDRRWLVLYDEDYDDVAIDLEDNVALLVDIHQAGEIIRLGAQALAELSHRDADGDDVIRDMTDELQRVADDE